MACAIPTYTLKSLTHRVHRYGARSVADSAVATGGFMVADLLRFGTHAPVGDLFIAAALLLGIFALVNYSFGLHRRVWRYATLQDVASVAAAVAVATALFSLVDLSVHAADRPYWLSTVPEGAVLAFSLLITAKLLPRLRTARPQSVRRPAGGKRLRALIVGAGQTGTMLARDFGLSQGARYQIIGFIDDDPAKLYMRVAGYPVLGTRRDIVRLVAELKIDLIAISIPSSTRDELDELVTICQCTGARVQIVPSLSEIATAPSGPVQLRELDIADLLGREEVRLDVVACTGYLEGRIVLVTGAAGSIGAELCRQLLRLRPSRLVLLDVNETGLFDLYASLEPDAYDTDLTVCIADITDEARVAQVFARYRPQVVFHAAAYKHVPLLQEHPGEAIKANVLGTAVLCRAARAGGVDRFVFVSSDKAVAAANNLGYSKRVGELLVRAYAAEGQTVFCAVRFGNVIGSRGSVVPTFERQIAMGGPVTVTHRDVTRFFMSIPEAACLVIQAAANAVSGSIFMLDMGQPVSIVSLAEKMIRLRGLRVGADIDITFTGLRPGEKMHEELTSAIEDTRPTGYAKIMEVIDPHPVSQGELDRAVSILVALARCSDAEHVGDALRAVAQGQPIAEPLDAIAAAYGHGYAPFIGSTTATTAMQVSPAAVTAAGRVWPLQRAVLGYALDEATGDLSERVGRRARAGTRITVTAARSRTPLARAPDRTLNLVNLGTRRPPSTDEWSLVVEDKRLLASQEHPRARAPTLPL